MFSDVSSILEYAYRFDGYDGYPRCTIAPEDGVIRRSSSSLTLVEHVTQAAMILSLAKRSLSEQQIAVLEVSFIPPFEQYRWARRAKAATVLTESYTQVRSTRRSPEFVAAQVLRCAGGGRGRRATAREGGDIRYVSQQSWARREGVSPHTVSAFGRDLKRWMAQEQAAATALLEIPFREARLLVVL